MRIAIIGSGISGLMAAHVLSGAHDVTMFEAAHRFGGHTNTVRFDLGDSTHDVDTGFIVYNERNYPTLTRLFRELNVITQPSEMSFSVRDETGGVEWAGTSLRGVFAQRSNARDPRFIAMLVDIARFSRIAAVRLREPDDPSFTLQDLLDAHRWSRAFMDLYLVPLGAAIWSADPATFTKFPADTFLRFCDNHGLLTYRNRPKWRTVTGGAINYVRAITEAMSDRIRLNAPVANVARTSSHVEVRIGSDSFNFDHVVMACHSDDALRLLSDATRLETETLGAIRYQPNTATLHTDVTLMPIRAGAWASWNYLREGPNAPAILTYDMNRLQNIVSSSPILVTLNGRSAIADAKVIAEFQYAHPVFDSAAIRAQAKHRSLCTTQTSFCGAYWGYGFHEDGARSGLQVARWLGVRW